METWRQLELQVSAEIIDQSYNVTEKSFGSSGMGRFIYALARKGARLQCKLAHINPSVWF